MTTPTDGKSQLDRLEMLFVGADREPLLMNFRLDLVSPGNWSDMKRREPRIETEFGNYLKTTDQLAMRDEINAHFEYIDITVFERFPAYIARVVVYEKQRT
ncbi:hypothetical protein HYV86_02405 [Candidatus Woesearchaeota archaeon]|nr:hypothetical protein [Candidatus Woesearchaeota archaeon]